MSSYCERCGNQLRDGAKFCHSCGAGAPAQPPAQPPAQMATPRSSAYQPQSYPQSPQPWSSAQPPYVEPPKASSGVAKFIIIAMLVILGFVGVVGIGAWVLFRRAVKTVRVTEDSSGKTSHCDQSSRWGRAQNRFRFRRDRRRTRCPNISRFDAVKGWGFSKHQRSRSRWLEGWWMGWCCHLYD